MHIDTVILDPVITLRKCVKALNELDTLGVAILTGYDLTLDASATSSPAAIHFWSGAPVVGHMIYANSGDRGFRFHYNYQEPYVAGNSYTDATLVQISMDFEQDGGWSLNWGKASTTTGGAYDGLPGKALIVYGGGFQEGVGPYAAANVNVAMAVMQAGRGLKIGTSATHAAPIFKIQIDASGADPLWLYVNSGLRNIKTFNDGAGHNVLYY